MNTFSKDARLLASISWRLMLAAFAAFLFLFISFVGLRRFDWLICRCYGQCIPSLLLLASVIGCDNRRLQLPACASAALAPFFTWYLVSDKPSAHVIWSSVLWLAATIWFAFELTLFIRSCANGAECEWLGKMARNAHLSLLYLLVVPLCAIVVANSVVTGLPYRAVFWDATIQSLHDAPQYMLPFAWNAFILFKLCCAAVLASHQAIRQRFDLEQLLASAKETDSNQEPQPSDSQEITS